MGKVHQLRRLVYQLPVCLPFVACRNDATCFATRRHLKCFEATFQSFINCVATYAEPQSNFFGGQPLRYKHETLQLTLAQRAEERIIATVRVVLKS